MITHGSRIPVRTEEIPASQRAPMLSAYLEKRALSKSPTSAAHDYFGVQPHLPQEELERIAVRYPVFKLLPERRSKNRITDDIRRQAAAEYRGGNSGRPEPFYSSHSVLKEGLAWMQTRFERPGPSLVNLCGTPAGAMMMSPGPALWRVSPS